LDIQEDSFLYSLIMFCKERKCYKANRCLYDKDYYPITEFNNNSDIRLQPFVPLENKVVINERFPK
jgi:hypothetical protein